MPGRVLSSLMAGPILISDSTPVSGFLVPALPPRPIPTLLSLGSTCPAGAGDHHPGAWREVDTGEAFPGPPSVFKCVSCPQPRRSVYLHVLKSLRLRCRLPQARPGHWGRGEASFLPSSHSLWPLALCPSSPGDLAWPLSTPPAHKASSPSFSHEEAPASPPADLGADVPQSVPLATPVTPAFGKERSMPGNVSPGPQPPTPTSCKAG